MEFYIREWDDGHATLMTEQGHVLWTFGCVEEAQSACHEWSCIHQENVDCYVGVQ
jgi:hypothetical protein